MRPRNPYQVRDRETLQKRISESHRVIPHTTRSLAELTGVSHGTIGDLLTGRKARVSLNLAQRLSAILGRPMDDLFVPTPSTSTDSVKEEA
jgi:transcriptional regulator with XRE-family HTH domain